MPPPPPRRFAILEHDHPTLHWDVLIEDGDALRTWAVDAAIMPGRELPARALAPHRRVYLDYEGPISGGRGSVRRWDAGECDVIVWESDRAVIDLRGGQVAGRAEIRRLGDDPTRGWAFRLGKLS